MEFTLDANVYISYFIDRDPEQYKIASLYINKLEKQEIFIFLPSLIVAEVVYILEKGYQIDRKDITYPISSLIYENNLMTEDKNIILLALENFESSSLDFADCYLLALSENQKTEIITFDKQLKNKL